MRLRRGLPLLLVVGALGLGACGDESAPDLGSGDLTAADPALAPATDSAAEQAAAMGEATAELAVPYPVGADTTSAETSAAVEALCERVQILVVTAASMGPDHTDAELLTIGEGVESIATEAGVLTSGSEGRTLARLRACVRDLDDLPI